MESTAYIPNLFAMPKNIAIQVPKNQIYSPKQIGSAKSRVLL